MSHHRGGPSDGAARLRTGAEIPYFYVREVTGPRPNLAMCLVCRYGARPVALVCVRKIDDQVAALLEGVDRVVDSHRGVGLKGFAIFLDADTPTVQPQLVTLARKHKLSLPLSFPVETSGPRTLQLPEDARVTVLLYQHKTVQERFIFEPGELTAAKVDAVVRRVEAMTPREK